MSATEPATLEPIEYLAVERGNWRAGYVVPPHERARWDAAPLRTPTKPVDTDTKSLTTILEELDGPLFLDSRLRARLEASYDLDAARTSSLTTWILEHAVAGGARNPAGILWKRLGEIERSKTNQH